MSNTTATRPALTETQEAILLAPRTRTVLLEGPKADLRRLADLGFARREVGQGKTARGWKAYERFYPVLPAIAAHFGWDA